MKILRAYKFKFKTNDELIDKFNKISTQFSKNHVVIVLEDLKVANMSKSVRGDINNIGKCVKAKSGLNKSII